MEENEIAKAADELQTTIALEVGKLADRILGRPEIGSPEWHEQWDALKGDHEASQAYQRVWHLTKVAILREAGASQTGAVINARRYGATWQAIADACGITRQGAFDRWAKYTTQEDDAR